MLSVLHTFCLFVCDLLKSRWQLPELTSESFGVDGFFRTGDLAKLDDDGYVSITGRIKDLIIRGGVNIAPADVEGVLFKYPRIASVAVVGAGETCAAEIDGRPLNLLALQIANDPMETGATKGFLNCFLRRIKCAYRLTGPQWKCDDSCSNAIPLEIEMCGIVGLFLKNKKLESELGGLLAAMLEPLSDRGPDSAGFAIYGSEKPGFIKFTLRQTGDAEFSSTIGELKRAFPGKTFRTSRVGNHAVLSSPKDCVSVENSKHRNYWFGSSHGDLQGSWPPNGSVKVFQARENVRDPRHRPHADGNRVCCDNKWCASLYCWVGSVLGAQWIAIEPQRGEARSYSKASFIPNRE
jgi:hypothetical protein